MVKIIKKILTDEKARFLEYLPCSHSAAPMTQTEKSSWAVGSIEFSQLSQLSNHDDLHPASEHSEIPPNVVQQMPLTSESSTILV